MSARACSRPAYPSAKLPPDFCGWSFASDLPDARGLWIDDTGDLLVLARGKAAGSQIVAVWDSDGDGVSTGDGERAILGGAAGLNHGLTVQGGYLYASSDEKVYRWPYTAGQRYVSISLSLSHTHTHTHSVCACLD